MKSFGVLGDVEVELGRLNVLVGPNGSGKSTLLRVIDFLGDAARNQLVNAVAARGGFERLRTRGRSSPIEIRVKATVTQYAHKGALDEYVLKFGPLRLGRATLGRDRLAIEQDETFTFKRTRGKGRRITLRGGRLQIHDAGRERSFALSREAFGLAVLPQLGRAEGATEVRLVQELFTKFRVFDVDADKARRPADVRPSEGLRGDASNLAAFLALLSVEHQELFSRLTRDARTIVPGLRDLKLRVVGGPTEAVAVDIEDEGLPGVTPLADASFGTVRALAMLAMLHDPSPPLLTCVEEIDHGFHPHVFDRLVELLREASTRTQLLIATHSPALVNRLRPAELIVCERDSLTGLARIPAIDARDVADLVDASDYGLGELWFSGTLGGVPR